MDETKAYAQLAEFLHDHPDIHVDMTGKEVNGYTVSICWKGMKQLSLISRYSHEELYIAIREAINIAEER